MSPPADEAASIEVIVQGVFRVAAEDRAAYLAESIEQMATSRAEPGCLEYVLAADPVEHDRVVLCERWESQAALDEHLRVLVERRRDAPDAGSATGVEVLSRVIAVYSVATARSLVV